MPKKVDKLTEYLAEQAAQPTSNNGKEQKVVEFYLDMLAKHQRDLGKQKLSVWMQVGSFFEVYGLKYPDGRLVGNVWDIAQDLDIKVALKGQTAYDDPNIEVYMAGVKEEYAEPYLERLVDRYGWTVAVYTQEKMGSSNKFERVCRQIISPGLNFETDALTNNFMYLYFKAGVDRSVALYATTPLRVGIYYVDCISGENGATELYTKDINEYGVVFSELVKLITIKNPAELVCHLDIPEVASYKQFSESELYSNLGFFEKAVRFVKTAHMEPMAPAKQQLLLEKAYHAHKGRLTIFQQLGVDNQFDYGRMAMCLGLEYIFQHDTQIIQHLDKPMILASSSAYMMLANNCLQQLDIIDPLAKNRISQLSRDSELLETNKLGGGSSGVFGKRVTLLELLDKTKTVMGRRLFRQRLSIPITSVKELEARYDQVESWQRIQRAYLAQPQREVVLSPIRKLRGALATIGDIPKMVRKLFTSKAVPADMEPFGVSLAGIMDVFALVRGYAPESLPGGDVIHGVDAMFKLMTATFDYDVCSSHWSQIESNIFKPGVNTVADGLMADITTDVQFFELLKKGLASGDCAVNEDTNVKQGRYLWLNDKSKAALETRVKLNPDAEIQVGTYTIRLDELSFVNLKKGRWHIQTNYLYLSSKNLGASIDKLKKCIRAAFQSWQTEFIMTWQSALQACVAFISELDVVQSAVYTADAYGYKRPRMVPHEAHDHAYVSVKGIRHPIVERLRQDTQYVANDLDFGVPGQSGILLFGLNSSGKSTTMKAIGCALIMAQAGLFVPATAFTYWPYQYLFTRIRNNDDIYAGLSSFEVEMKEFKVILKYADANGLILGDELCSGTETLDATALVASGLQTLCRRDASFLFATHLHFLSEIECVTELPNLKFYHLAVERKGDKLIYDRVLKPGNGPQSYGILVCKSMALDMEFIREAERIRAGIERGEILSGFSSAKPGNGDEVKQNYGDARQSHFNREKLFQLCEVCQERDGEEIHHIGQQADTDCRGLMDSGAHKNSKWNLVCLCKDCHLGVHQGQFKIQGYIQTSHGIELSWSGAGTVESKILLHSNGTPSGSLSHPEGVYDKTRLCGARDDVKALVAGLKADGKTLRSIQTTLRKQGIQMKLSELEGMN